MLHVEPSYRIYCNSDVFLSKFRTSFKGEGLYIWHDWLLLAQLDQSNEINPIKGLIYDFPIQETIFSQIHSIPVIY